MSAPPLPNSIDSDDDLHALLGPARLAMQTPIREYPSLADRKASALLAANALILSVLLFLLNTLQGLAARSTPLAILLGACGLVLLILVAIGGTHAYRCMVRATPAMPGCMAYYREIGTLDREHYAAAMRAITHRQVIRAMLHYNHAIATQSAAKFALVNRSVRCFRIALPLWMGLLLLIAVFGG